MNYAAIFDVIGTATATAAASPERTENENEKRSSHKLSSLKMHTVTFFWLHKIWCCTLNTTYNYSRTKTSRKRKLFGNVLQLYLSQSYEIHECNFMQHTNISNLSPIFSRSLSLSLSLSFSPIPLFPLIHSISKILFVGSFVPHTQIYLFQWFYYYIFRHNLLFYYTTDQMHIGKNGMKSRSSLCECIHAIHPKWKFLVAYGYA